MQASEVAVHGLCGCGLGALGALGALERMSSVVAAPGFEVLQGTWDLPLLTGDRTRIPCTARPILNHWTTREVPSNDVIVI